MLITAIHRQYLTALVENSNGIRTTLLHKQF